jgi:hypothetical protein
MHDGRMTYEPWELEGLANSVFRVTGIDPATAPSPAEIVKAHPDIQVEYVMRASRPARFGYIRGVPTMRILNTAPALARAWFIAHELGEIVLHRAGADDEAVEQLADNVAACIIAPTVAVRTIRNRYDLDFEHAARRLRLSQTILALRYGEIWGGLVIVLERSRVKTRGGFEIPSERDLRRIAAAGGGDGLTVIPVTDAPGRMLLLGA